MGWVDALSGSVVGLDTCPLIYFIEEHPEHFRQVEPFFAAADKGEFRIVTSFVTLTEVLIHPLRQGLEDLARQYRDVLLGSDHLTALAVDREIAEQAAALRAQHGLRTPDAIQLATALRAGASWFPTNDTAFPEVPGLSVLIVKHLA